MAWNLSTGMILALLGKDATAGSLSQILENSVIDIFEGIRPANADLTEVGAVKLLTITLNGGAFTAGIATNGLNMGEFDGVTLKRAIDAATSVTEVWKAVGLAAGTAGWGRWYRNDKITGASSTAIRLDGVVSISDAEITMANGTGVTVGVESTITGVSFNLGGVDSL